MNKWVEKSIEVANAPRYLDSLTEIYPATPSPHRPLSRVVKRRIKALCEEGESFKLLMLMLELEGHPFPIEHPYVSLFRRNPELIDQNPEVVGQIGHILLSLGDEGVIRGCERPPDLNRQIGPAFQNWLRSYFSQRGFAFLSELEFEKYQGKAFLDARNARVSRYANTKLGCQLTRGRDFLAKVRGKFVIGEARFLSTSGGSQSRDVRETVGFVKDKAGNAIRVAVLDGMVWFDTAMLAVVQNLGDDEPALSALLLEDFLKSLR